MGVAPEHTMEETAAELVRDARRQAGLSQAELARRSGVARPVVWAIEHGRRQPSLPTLARVLRGAGVRLELHAVPLQQGRRLVVGGDERRRALEVSDALELADNLRRAKQLERSRPDLAATDPRL